MMLCFMRHSLKEALSFANIVETPSEQQIDDTQLRNWCFNEYLLKIQGKVFVNKKTKIPIIVHKDLKGEIISKLRAYPNHHSSKVRARLLALKNLWRLLEDSDPDTLYEPDKKHRALIEYLHTFKYECRINGKRYLARILTEKPVGQYNKTYFLYLDDFEVMEK